MKLSGDGARMTRSTNFIMFLFALLQKPNVMSSKSNRTVAIVNGKEEYETLASSLKDFFQEVNSLIAQGAILIDGQKVKLDFFLGGDFKFLAMIRGIQQQQTLLVHGAKSINRIDAHKPKLLFFP